MHSIAEKSHKMLWKATEKPTIKSHVAQGKNINNVVESSKSPVITGFFHAPNTSEYALDTLFSGKFAIF